MDPKIANAFSLQMPDLKGQEYWEAQLHEAEDMVKCGFAKKTSAERQLYLLREKGTAKIAAKSTS